MLKNKRNRFRLKINHYSSHKIFKQFSYLGKIDIFEKIQRFKDEN